jgi:hypothetical protein
MASTLTPLQNTTIILKGAVIFSQPTLKICNIIRYYRFKRSEYAARGVLEYWAIDPEEHQIL